MGCSASMASSPQRLKAPLPQVSKSNSRNASGSAVKFLDVEKTGTSGTSGNPGGPGSRPPSGTRPPAEVGLLGVEGFGSFGLEAATPAGSNYSNSLVDSASECSSECSDELDSAGGVNSDTRSHNKLFERLEEAAAVGGVQIDDSPLAAVSKGITLRGLRKLKERIEAVFGDAYLSVSTTEVNTAWVQVVTAGPQCRLAEMPDLVHPRDVGVPHYFISHAWQNSFDHLLRRIEGFLENAAEDTRIWLDIVAVNQHAGTHQRADVSAFKDVVNSASRGTLVVMDPGGCNPSTRAWCIYEWAATLAAHGPDGLHMQLTATERTTMMNTLDLEKAKCFSSEDKLAILSNIVDQYGSVKAFNDRLKLMLMLQPLSYRVDLRRLNGRSTGTAWEFGPVQQWLEAGPGGARALCVMAGAGEGKSTISAALCESETCRDSIAAYHFIKFSDQRRLDPVRVVNSLAFQIAERLPQFRAHILDEDVATVTAITEPEQAFELLLRKPLEKALQSGPTSGSGCDQPQPLQLVLLIDSLDEADQPLQPHHGNSSYDGTGRANTSSLPAAAVCGNKLFLLLAKHLKALPPYVRFILTMRPSGLSGSIATSLTSAFDGSVTFVEPPMFRRAAMLTAAESEPTGSSSGGAGALVYHTVVSGCLSKAAPDVQPPALSGTPQLADVYRVYGLVFADGLAKLRKASLRAVRWLLAVLLAAQEPLPQALLHSMGLGGALELLPGYPVTFYVEEHHAYVLHKSLSEWLADPQVSGDISVRVLRGHRRLASRLLLTVQAGNPTPYALKYLVRHLVCCRDGPSLEGLLHNYGFVATVFSQGHGHTIIRDLLQLPKPSRMVADLMRWLLVSQHQLVGANSADDVVTNLLRCPVGTLMFHGVQEHVLGRAVVAGRPKWRLHNSMGVLATWPVIMMTLQGHTKAVTSVEWSPDGRNIATGSEDGTVRMWGAASGECLAVLKGHSDSLTCVAWSPDGRVLASGGKDKVARLWDTASGECSATLKGHTSSVDFVVWCSGGKTLVTGCFYSGVLLWDVATAENTAEIKVPSEIAIKCAAWSQKANALACGCIDNAVRVFDLDTGKCAGKLEGHKGLVGSVAWTKDGKVLATGSADKSLRLWGWWAPANQTPKLWLRKEMRTSKAVDKVAWSPDGRMVACCNRGNAVELWEAKNSECAAKLQDPSMTVTCATWSPDGRKLSTGGGCDGAIRIWDAAGVEKGAETKGHTSHVGCVTWSPEGKTIASGSHDQTVRLWDAATGNCTRVLEGHSDVVRSVSWSPNGKTLASCGNDRTVMLWDIPTVNCTATLKGHTACVWNVAWSPSGAALASCGEDQVVWLWDAASGRCTAKLKGHTDDVLAVAWSPDGRQLASGGRGRGVRIWDVESRTCTATLQGHCRAVTSVAWSPTVGALATGSEDDSVRVWDVASGKCTATLRGHTNFVASVAWCPDGVALASASKDTSVRVWDVASGECTAWLQGHSDFASSVCWSPDGKSLASGSGDKSIRVYDIE